MEMLCLNSKSEGIDQLYSMDKYIQNSKKKGGKQRKEKKTAVTRILFLSPKHNNN